MNRLSRILLLALASWIGQAQAAEPVASAALPTEPVAMTARRLPQAAHAALLAAARAGARLVAVGEHGVVMLSDDQGRTFRQAREVPLDVTLTSVSFVDERQGWAVGHWGAVLSTRDGGVTWTVQRKDVLSDRPLFAVHFFDVRRGVAVGLWSLVLVTEDGGASWRTVTLAVPEGAKKADLNLLGLFGDDRGRIFAAAEKGMLLRSEDRGATWTYTATGYTGSFWTGVALPGGVLLAAGLRGSMYRSADDGRSWVRVETGSKSSITAMAERGGEVLAVGLDGLVLRSTDAGAAFSSQVRPDRAALTALVLMPDGRASYFSRQGVVSSATPPGREVTVPLDMQRGGAVLSVDLGALVDNWLALSRRVAPAACGAVIKADAYGLGATPVARALLQAGCREFFVALVDEGVRLRESLGPAWPKDARLHVLQGAGPGAERDCLSHGLVPVLCNVDQVARWQALARRQGHALPGALQVDTSMSRMGLPSTLLGQLADTPQDLSGISVTLVMSQLLGTDDPRDPLSRLQLELFRPWRSRFPAALGSLANSAGIFLGPAYHFDLVRPGEALYGVAPVAGQPNPMRPVVGLQARLLRCSEVDHGKRQTDRHGGPKGCVSRLATVALAQADGVLRCAGDPGHLRFRGVPVPVVGQATADAVTVDVTAIDADQLAPGALFDVLDAVQDVGALAQAANTSAFEVLTQLGANFRRQYFGSAAL